MEPCSGLSRQSQNRVYVCGGYEIEGEAKRSGDVEAIMNLHVGKWIASVDPMSVVCSVAFSIAP